MKKFILPALAAAVFGASLLAASPGDTKSTKKDCSGCCCKDHKDAKVKETKDSKPEAPKA